MVKTERNEDNVVLSLRLRGAEAVRFWVLMDAAKSRNPYIDRTNVLRELFGLDKPSLLTEGEIAFFQTGDKTESAPTIKGYQNIILHPDNATNDAEPFAVPVVPENDLTKFKKTKKKAG